RSKSQLASPPAQVEIPRSRMIYPKNAVDRNNGQEITLSNSNTSCEANGMDDRTDRWTSVKACSGAETWTRAERFVFLLSTVIICALAYLYCFHMWRHIPFDEVGLHNPIYMYYTTGHMIYPMHGQPDFMTVQWFAGLVALQSAKNKNWSEWWLFLG